MNKAKVNLIIAMIIYGSIGLFVRNINLSSAQIALSRGIIGSMFLLITIIIMGKKINWESIRKNLLLLIISGVIFGYNWILLFQAYKYTTITNATLAYYCAPIFVVLVSPIVLKESLTMKKILCTLAAMVGMFFITKTSGPEASNNLIGIAYGLGAAGLYAGVVLVNKLFKGLTGIESTFFQLGIATISILFYVLFSENLGYTALNTSGWILLLIVGIVHTGIAYILFFSSIPQLPGQTVAIFSYIDPIAAVIMSSIFLHEKMNIFQILGGILIIGSAFMSQRKTEKLAEVNPANN